MPERPTISEADQVSEVVDCLTKTLPWQISCAACLQKVDFDDDDNDFSDDHLQALNICGKAIPNTSCWMIRLHALKRIEACRIKANHYERIKAKIPADTERTRKQDEELRLTPIEDAQAQAEVQTKAEVPVEAPAQRLARWDSGLGRARFTRDTWSKKKSVSLSMAA
ncbi:hypothetical protein ARMSODRAFT_969132 [Armillaria solidipes]|uniref:Uncharacterized protein n=1 Tax=Armillaria solidipes TaxID=1076256 RepID=A0A2H3CM81_9AGAR|nr:hypothetical protein ARMSODRAFT_969132 [Armillaria solidipes]